MASVGSGFVSVLSSVFTATADDVQKASIVLVTIDLPGHGANPDTTLHLATREYVGPDGVRWDPILAEAPPIDHGGNDLETGWQPVDAVVTMLDLPINGQAAGESFSSLLLTHKFASARIHIQQTFDNILSISDYRTIFDGKIARLDSLSATSLAWHCVQDRSWEQKCPPNVLTQADYPYAPTDVVGVARPILLGDWETGIKSIGSVGTANETWKAGVMRAAFPTLMVELESSTGAATSPKVLVSDKDMLSSPVGLMYFENLLGVYAHSFAALTVAGSGPVTAQLDDYQFAAAVIPIEVDATTTATDAQELIRKDKKSTLEGRATLDYNAGRRIIRLLLPDVSPLGTLVDAYAFIWFNKPTTSGSHPRWGVENSTTANNLVAFGGLATTPTSGDTPHDSAVMQIGPVARGGSGTINLWENIADTKLLVEVRNAAETMDIHRFVVLLVYKPAARLVRPGTTVSEVGSTRYDVRGRRVSGPPLESGKTFRKQWDVTTPDVTSFDASLYAYGTGVPDETHASGAANGTYTGTAGALIEHPVDMVHWLLREFGDLGSNHVAGTSGVFGSFPDARTSLAGYKFRVHLTQRADLDSVIEGIGLEAMCWFHRIPTEVGAPFVAIPWGIGSTVNYRSASDPFTFYRARNHVVEGSFRPGHSPISRVRNAIRVNYDWDPRTNAFAKQVYITPDQSRVYSGSAFTTDAARVAIAAESEDQYGRAEEVLSLRYVADDATATAILQRRFDLRSGVVVTVQFATWLNAYDLNRGHVISFAGDWDSRYVYPEAGSDGSWEGKSFRVVRVKRGRGRPSGYLVDAVAV